jgi:lysophospholipase L1-like esterase
VKRRLLGVAACCGAALAAESLLTRHYYGRSYNYYRAAEVYWEDQQTLLLYLPDRLLFWRLRPNIRLKATETNEVFELRPERSGRRRFEWELRVGPKGFRGEDFPARRPAGELRVACFGDSRTIGEALEERDTYPARLASTLADRLPGRQVRVLNLGADGWSSHQGLALLDSQAAGYSPDVAVFAFGVNDTDTDWGLSDLDKARAMDSAFVTLQATLYRSMTFYWAQRQFLRAKGALFGRTRVVRPERDASGKRRSRVSEAEYAANLAAFAAACRRSGIEPVLLLLPVSPYRDWSSYAVPASDYASRFAQAQELQRRGEFAAAHAAFAAAAESTVFAAWSRAARERATAERIAVVDMSRPFLDVMQHESLYVDEMHPSPRGADLIARFLADAIVTQLR